MRSLRSPATAERQGGHPLNRTIAIDEDADRLTITTIDVIQRGVSARY
jgi:hypothetical protein